MNIVIEDPQIEHLVRRIAAAEGVSVEAVVRASLVSLAGMHGIPAHDSRPMRDRLAALALEVDAVPRSTDDRTDDQVLGYDERGLW
jgi:hypothetical protein